MASAQLTDEELFSELKRLGFTPGPVTENTRPVYLKKLKKLREEQPQSRGSRSGKARNSTGTISNNGGGSSSGSGSAAARAPGLSARPPGSDVTRRSAGGRPTPNEKRRTERTGKFVLGFSSDESDVEAPQKKAGPNVGSASRRDRGSALQTPIRPAGTPAASRRSEHRYSLGLSVDRKGTSGSPWWAKSSIDADGRDYGEPNDNLEETETNSHAINGNKTFYVLSNVSSNSSKLVKDYSDSDEEEEEEGDRDRPRRLTSRHSPPKSSFSSPYISARGSEKTPDFSSRDMVVERKEDEDKEPMEFGAGFLSHNYPKQSMLFSVDDGTSSPSAFTKNHLDNGDDEPSSSSSRFSIGLRPRFSSYTGLPATYRTNHSNHTGSNHSYSHSSSLKPKHTTVPEDELLQQFKREEVSATGGFSAHYLSMILLTAACLFFVILGLMYLRMRGSSISETDVAGEYQSVGTVMCNV